jgi:hypothetical protein
MPVDSETPLMTSSISRSIDVSVFRRCTYIGIGCVHEFIEIIVRACISVNPANNRGTFWFNTYMQLGYPKHVSVILDVWYSVSQ